MLATSLLSLTLLLPAAVPQSVGGTTQFRGSTGAGARAPRVAARVVSLSPTVVATSLALDGLGRPVLGGIVVGSHLPALYVIEDDGTVTTTVLDALVGGGFGDVRAITADGTTCAGNSESPNVPGFPGEATWWSTGAPASPVAAGTVYSGAYLQAVTNSPTGVAGAGSSQGRAYGYHETLGGFELPDLSGGFGTFGNAIDISADGTKRVGRTTDVMATPTSRAILWTSNGATHTATDLANGYHGQALSISPDGAHIGGSIDYIPVVWLAQDGSVPRTLLGPDGSETGGSVREIANNGLAIGKISHTYANRPFVWHPSFSTNNVLLVDDWMAWQGVDLPPLNTILDVLDDGTHIHFLVRDFVRGEYHYVRTPRL